MAAAATLCTALLIPAISGQVQASVPSVSGKADRLDFHRYGKDCSARAWPYLEARCLRNTVSAGRTVKPVRIVTADRI
jgi:hypothetical protein